MHFYLLSVLLLFQPPAPATFFEVGFSSLICNGMSCSWHFVSGMFGKHSENPIVLGGIRIFPSNISVEQCNRHNLSKPGNLHIISTTALVRIICSRAGYSLIISAMLQLNFSINRSSGVFWQILRTPACGKSPVNMQPVRAQMTTRWLFCRTIRNVSSKPPWILHDLPSLFWA